MEDDVWIGDNVTLKKGITLHTGCVVGANSLVTHDVPSYAVVGGTPARVIKYRFDAHMITKLLESRWFDYDVNYMEMPSDIYAYEFLNLFMEQKDKLPKLKTVKLGDMLDNFREKSRAAFEKKIFSLAENGKLIVNKEDIAENDNFLVLLNFLYRKGILGRNVQGIIDICRRDRWREMLLHVFLRLEKDRRLEFFSMKGDSIWFHYVPFLNNGKSKVLQVPLERSGKTWPSAEKENTSVFATYMSLQGNDVFISIEMSASDVAKARRLAEVVGYEKKNSPGAIIRLETKRFPYGDEKELNSAVNAALDELCRIGDKLDEALNDIEL